MEYARLVAFFTHFDTGKLTSGEGYAFCTPLRFFRSRANFEFHTDRGRLTPHIPPQDAQNRELSPLRESGDAEYASTLRCPG